MKIILIGKSFGGYDFDSPVQTYINRSLLEINDYSETILSKERKMEIIKYNFMHNTCDYILLKFPCNSDKPMLKNREQVSLYNGGEKIEFIPDLDHTHMEVGEDGFTDEERKMLDDMIKWAERGCEDESETN